MLIAYYITYFFYFNHSLQPMLFLELFVYTCSLRKSDDLLFIPHHPLGVMVNIYIMGDYYQTEVQIWIIIIMFGHTM